MSTPCSVLIVGAGPTGLTLGCQLRLAGIGCRLVERANFRSKESRALGVHARSLEVLERLGVVERMLAAGTPTEYLSLHVGGRPLVRLPYKDLDAPYPCMLVIPQCETERILEERFQELGGTIERGVTLEKVDVQATGALVTLVSDAGEEQGSFSYVVGCDGAHSTVRSTLGVPFEGAQYEETFVLGDVRLGRDVPRNEAVAFASTRGVLVVLPLPQGRNRVIGPAGDHLAPGRSGPLPFEDFERVVRELDVLGEAPMTCPLWVARFNVHRRLAQTFRVGPVFLAGDAAHIHSPAGGQGMNLGIQDAFNLGWKLAMVIDGVASPKVLDSYEVERRPVALTTVNATDSATKLATIRNPIAIVLRNLLIPFVLRHVLARRMLLGASQLGTSYAPHALAFDAAARKGLVAFVVRLATVLLVLLGLRSRPLASGVRAPDAVLDPASKARLFTELDPKSYTLLVFAGSRDPDGVMAEVGRMVSPYASHVQTRVVTRGPTRHARGGALVDRTGAAHRKYRAGGGCLCLVRPDGYIALSADLAMMSQVEKSLEGLLPGLRLQRPRSFATHHVELSSTSSAQEGRT